MISFAKRTCRKNMHYFAYIVYRQMQYVVLFSEAVILTGVYDTEFRGKIPTHYEMPHM